MAATGRRVRNASESSDDYDIKISGGYLSTSPDGGDLLTKGRDSERHLDADEATVALTDWPEPPAQGADLEEADSTTAYQMHHSLWIVVNMCPLVSAEDFTAVKRALPQRLAQQQSVLLSVRPPSALLQLMHDLLHADGSKACALIIASVSELLISLARELGTDPAPLQSQLQQLTSLTSEHNRSAKLVRSISQHPQHHAVLLAWAQTAIATLLTQCLNLSSSSTNSSESIELGLNARFVDARMLLRTRDTSSRGAYGAHNERHRFLLGTCDAVPDPTLSDRLIGAASSAASLPAAGRTVIVTQCSVAASRDGETILLQHEDLSSTYLAVMLQARRLEVWTRHEPAGFTTADPSLVSTGVRVIEHVAYTEATELATFGARIIHPECFPLLRALRIPVHIYPFAHVTTMLVPVTSIGGAAAPTQASTTHMAPPSVGLAGAVADVKAVFSKSDVVVVSMQTVGMWQQVGFLATVFAIFGRLGVSVGLVGTSETNVTISVDSKHSNRELKVLLHELRLHCDAWLVPGCVAVSVIGPGVSSTLHRLTPVLDKFKDRRVYLISQAALNLTVVYDARHRPDTAREVVSAIHEVLFPQ